MCMHERCISVKGGGVLPLQIIKCKLNPQKVREYLGLLEDSPLYRSDVTIARSVYLRISWMRVDCCAHVRGRGHANGSWCCAFARAHTNTQKCVRKMCAHACTRACWGCLTAPPRTTHTSPETVCSCLIQWGRGGRLRSKVDPDKLEDYIEVSPSPSSPAPPPPCPSLPSLST